MIRAHRRFHKFFWLVAAPLLVLFYVVFQPSDKNNLMPIQTIPDGSSIAVFSDPNDSAAETKKQ